MKNKLIDLNNYLFEQIEKLNDDVSDEDLEKTLKKAETISDISKVIIQNSALQLKAIQVADNYGLVKQESLGLFLGVATNEKQV